MVGQRRCLACLLALRCIVLLLLLLLLLALDTRGVHACPCNHQQSTRLRDGCSCGGTRKRLPVVLDCAPELRRVWCVVGVVQWVVCAPQSICARTG